MATLDPRISSAKVALRTAERALVEVRAAIVDGSDVPAVRLVEAEAEVRAALLRFEAAQRVVDGERDAAEAAKRARVEARDLKRRMARADVDRQTTIDSQVLAVESGQAESIYADLAANGSVPARIELEALRAAKAAGGDGWQRRFVEARMEVQR